MQMIFMHDTYQGIGNMNIYRNAWKSFNENNNNINTRIAKELDVIQAIYQFCIYKRNGAIFEDKKEEEWLKEKEKICTEIGQEILKKIVLENFCDIFNDNQYADKE